MKFVPHNGMLLCKKVVSEEADAEVNGLVYKKQQLPLYEVLAVGELSELSGVQVGDTIVTNSIPAEINDNGTKYFLVREEYIAGKVIEQNEHRST